MIMWLTFLIAVITCQQQIKDMKKLSITKKKLSSVSSFLKPQLKNTIRNLNDKKPIVSDFKY